MAQPMRIRMTDYINELQETIVSKLETFGSGEKFRREVWCRDDGRGLSCTFPPLKTSIASKSLLVFCPPLTFKWTDHPIEKAGVNTSLIYGILSPAAIKHKSTALDNKSLFFFASGLSLILHFRHPRIPSVHANYRYFEVLDAPLQDPTTSTANVLAWWFGAITDMTPAYVDQVDFRHFHTALKTACDTWSDVEHTSISIYPPLKTACDDYLFIPHRHQHRGIGGIRFDDMDSDAMRTLLKEQPGAPSEEVLVRLSDQASLFALVKSLGDSFLPSFVCILERHMDEPIVPLEKRWQLLCRGRSVEFTLVVERGTKFGLATPGINPENVLVSMPPEARWEYCSELGTEDQDTEEAEMTRILKTPRCWID